MKPQRHRQSAKMDHVDPIPSADAAPGTVLCDADVRACVRVLRAIEADRSHLTRLTQDQRRELLTLAGLVAKPERRDLVKMAKAFRRAEREAAKEHDRKVLATAGLRIQRRSAEYAPLWLELPKSENLDDERPDSGDPADDRPTFHQDRACYVCKQPFAKVHRYYDSLCDACGDFNYAKRGQTADLDGHYALVTGARVKIGFQASLKLLRAGAHVIVTTRFPVDAAGRYAKEPDFPAFRERLQIHGIDLRHTPSVEIFARFLVERLPRLDYILNNACQTVRRPAGFFQHLLAREAESLSLLPPSLRGPLASHDELRRSLEDAQPAGAVVAAAVRGMATAHVAATAQRVTAAQVAATAHGVHGEGLLHSAALSQKRYLDEDFREGESIFPTNRYDEDQQQLN